MPKSLAILSFLAKLEKSNSNSLTYGLSNFPNLPSTGGSRAYLRAVGDLPSRELTAPPPLPRADGTFTRARDCVDRAGAGPSVAAAKGASAGAAARRRPSSCGAIGLLAMAESGRTGSSACSRRGWHARSGWKRRVARRRMVWHPEREEGAGLVYLRVTPPPVAGVASSRRVPWQRASAR